MITLAHIVAMVNAVYKVRWMRMAKYGDQLYKAMVRSDDNNDVALKYLHQQVSTGQWAAIEGDKAWAIIQPAGLVCHVVYAGGDDLKSLLALRPAIEQFAKSVGAEKIVFNAHYGLRRAMEKEGAKVTHYVMEIPA